MDMAAMIRFARVAVTLATIFSVVSARAQDSADSAGSGSPLEDGRQFYFAGDYAAARALWKPLAEAGNARALYNMATLYREGQGIARDPERARSLLHASAEAGFAEAQYLLASFLFDEAGDDEARRQEAVRLWLAAAEQGHVSARYRLGLLYWNGEAVARDLERGHAWMALAAKDGLELAAAALATMTDHLTEDELDRSSTLQGRLAEPPAADTPARQPQARSDPAPSGSVPSALPEKKPDAHASTEAEAENSPTADFAAGWRLQIAAFRARVDAEAEWRRLQSRAADLVTDMQHDVVRADLGERGVFYRLQIGPFGSRDMATNRCRALKAAGHGCFPLAPESD